MNSLRTLSCAAVLFVVLVGCGRGTDPAGKNEGGNQEPVIAFVAASTRDAVREIADAFTKERKTEVKINADDSSKLATQIVAGAPAHLFLSANEKWADFVKDKGLIQEMVPLLGNSLVMVVPTGNPAQVGRPEDLTKAAVKHLALAGPSVPAGIYARQALRKLGLWDALEKDRTVVSGENVRVALTYVERGEAEAGITYATDAKITDKVEQVFTFAASSHDPIRYPLALLKEGEQVPGSRAFFAFLQSPPAAAVFKKHGFTILGGR
jgi:molybdate transport system substrate-binding protein